METSQIEIKPQDLHLVKQTYQARLFLKKQVVQKLHQMINESNKRIEGLQLVSNHLMNTIKKIDGIEK